ncbi:MCE family protein [Actinocorallia sp. API 0066]|uniref:MlaD family protein n=1 Tax=Actinocorallia sp. API 0066 TaxID=2896846 RepID=UPI001E5C741E|nr:MCE family protein [Actinocorallia sp. API 0066]MCD0449310.1 MCE family protein [Actinocorallia sp. API 0066]
MALRSLRDVDQRRVAVVVTLLLAVTVAATFAYGQLGLFRGGYEMSGVFRDSGGIKRGDEVRQAGVRIGAVTEVTPDFATGTVVITWRVDGGVRLGPRTRAEITTANLLGGRYLRVSGPVTGPHLHTLPAAQRRIPVERTGVPHTLVDALNTGTTTLGALDVASITRILDEARQTKLPSPQNLRKLLLDLGALAATLNDHAPEIRRLITDSRRLSTVLAARTADLATLLDAARTLLRVIAEHRDTLSAALGASGRTLKALGDTVADREDEIDALLAGLHRMTAALAPRTAELNTGLALLGPTFKGFAAVADTGHLAGFLSGLGFLQPPQQVLIPEARP